MVKSQRDSNIELLRVVSMVMIVFYHFMARLSELNSAGNTQTIVNSLIPVVHIGVICFVLISGYWGIKFSIKGFLSLKNKEKLILEVKIMLKFEKTWNNFKHR